MLNLFDKTLLNFLLLLDFLMLWLIYFLVEARLLFKMVRLFNLNLFLILISLLENESFFLFLYFAYRVLLLSVLLLCRNLSIEVRSILETVISAETPLPARDIAHVDCCSVSTYHAAVTK